jgi:putative ABC transport system ATP-binding protein
VREVFDYVVETEDLTMTYKIKDHEVIALNKVNLKIERGDFIAIMGPSGSGKTTLINIIGGLDRPTKGRVILDGNDLNDMNETALTQLRCRKIGFVFQSYNLIPILTALENVELPTVAAKLSGDEGRSRALNILNQVGLGDRLNHRPLELSGGEQQRVAVARALVNSPSIVLADEPTGNLDSDTGLQLINLIRKLNIESGVTFIICTHDQMVAQHANRIIRIKDGNLVN